LNGGLTMAYTSLKGYDNESDCQSSKEEKWETSARAAKWIVLSIIIACGLIYAVKLNVQDIILKLNGNSIVTEFKNGTTFNGVDDEGQPVAVEYKDKTTVKVVKPVYDSNNDVSYQTSTEDYGKNRITAFTDNHGIIHVVPIMFTMLSPLSPEKVTVYYYGDDVGSAKALNSLWFWFILYLLLIPMLILCVKTAYRIKYPKSHVKLNANADENYKI